MFKKLCCLVFFPLALGAGSRTVRAADLAIVQDGKTTARIISAADAGPHEKRLLPIYRSTSS